MAETFAAWLKKVNVEVEGIVDSHNLEVRLECWDDGKISALVSFDGENLERLQGQKIQLPCCICHKCEMTETELAEATPVCENVVCLKKEFNKYIFL